MSAFSGVQGYETLSSAQQQERDAANVADHGHARRPSAPPPHLSRVLYIPPHSSSNVHALVHDVSTEYKHAIGHAPLGGSDIIGDALMGSRLFMTRLGTMAKPAPDAQETAAEYAIDAKVMETEALVTLQPSESGGVSRTVTVSLPKATDDFTLTGDNITDVTASFPVPDTTSSAGVARHPFFTFPCRDGPRELQWQIYPADSGPLRYMLVEMSDEAVNNVAEPKPEDIRAIYHHIGQSPSLSLSSSEGVLLLQPDYPTGVVLEGAVLASLLGLLWRVRGMELKPLAYDVQQGGKKSFLRRVLKG
ncbi:Dipeptidyl-peptidase 5 [Purpureocillium lavendulum]|uniref:Dipeptidyl-peptidase 5 n=1 Tax=Purpureocillium lavendulum TaxID=1247861 RepID=A0AB34GAU5_9HYPO|nr:Dipeptidyl-peptidase 5 [Purpureocillium lavendulum]